VSENGPLASSCVDERVLLLQATKDNSSLIFFQQPNQLANHPNQLSPTSPKPKTAPNQSYQHDSPQPKNQGGLKTLKAVSAQLAQQTQESTQILQSANSTSQKNDVKYSSPLHKPQSESHLSHTRGVGVFSSPRTPASTRRGPSGVSGQHGNISDVFSPFSPFAMSPAIDVNKIQPSTPFTGLLEHVTW